MNNNETWVDKDACNYLKNTRRISTFRAKARREVSRTKNLKNKNLKNKNNKIHFAAIRKTLKM